MPPTDSSWARRALGALIGALVWPLGERDWSPLELDLTRDPGAGPSWLRTVYGVALAIFPLIFVAFAALLAIDEVWYSRLLAEDGVVEWATVAALVVAAALAFGNAAAERRTIGAPSQRWLYLGLAMLCVVIALEEISWGQRLFGIANPDFFVAYSDQKEINVHNVVQKLTHVTMKWPVGLGFLAYGAVLPVWAAATQPQATLRRLRNWGVLVPPLSLVRGFLLASVLMLDLPTNDEEELAELFGVLALIVMLLGERARLGRAALLPPLFS